MGHARDEKGFTLIEVLVSITLLSIVLISYMNFFPQMARSNNMSQEKIIAVNDSKKYLIKWQDYDKLKEFLIEANGEDKEQTSIPMTNDDTDLSYNSFSWNEDDYIFTNDIENGKSVIIRVSKHSDLVSRPSQAHQIDVQFKKNEKVLSESYGYVLFELPGVQNGGE